MANNDLEKYAKALDKCVYSFSVPSSAHCLSSAIMKYHSLKMEEVNDTMRHLWNKTYQGTGQYKSLASIIHPQFYAYAAWIRRHRRYKDLFR